MSKIPFNHSENRHIISDNSSNLNLNTERGSLCRVHQIEDLLKVRITHTLNEIVDREISAQTNSSDQAIQLVRAFDLITNSKTRSDVLAMVIAIAQSESEPN